MVKRKVEVNQRALVDKALARYPEDFTVFRELLQNADDAGATEVQIEFQTSDHAEHSAGANAKVKRIDGTILDLNTIKVFKWVVRNNGNDFESKDWDRLTTIADGNPDEQKIGAFGVGFYSVFSVTDAPLVMSGGKSLSMFFEGDQLYAEDATCRDSKWTSIEMTLKEDMRGPIPKPFDLARFLTATMTFMSCLKTTSVFFNSEVFLKIAKSNGVPSNIPLPPDMVRNSKSGMMNIKTLSLVIQEITVNITDWALAAGTKKPSSQHSDMENQLNNHVKDKGFWANFKLSGMSEAPKVTPPPRASTHKQGPWSTHTAKYAVYSAEVMVSLSEDLHKGIKAVTKKAPPSRFDFKMVYFSKEQYDARAEEEKSDPMGSVFRGPQSLFPQLDGNREYMSRVFIGQSTSQTTGIGGHLFGRFIPTVERGSLDLTNGHIAKWNEELLYVGGFVARFVYEKEMNTIWNNWLDDVPTTGPATSSSKDKALYTMRYFSFHTSTPDGKVSNILQEAFFGCSKSDCFPIMSSSGIRYTKDVRRLHTDFSPFMKKMPVLLPMEAGDPPSLINCLQDPYKVRPYSFRDILDELEGRSLQDDEMIGLLRWWVAMYEYNKVPNCGIFQPKLWDAAKLTMGNPKRDVALSKIFKFVDPDVWLPWLRTDDPLPPDTIPLSFTTALGRKRIPEVLCWQPLTVVDWLKHLISPEIDSAHDIRASATYSNRVLVILGNISGTLSSDAKELMELVPWIATNKGFRRASEAYFQEVDIFHDLPVVTADLSDPHIPIILSEFGVKKRLDFDELFAKAEQSHTCSAEKMIRYLESEPSTHDRLDDIQTRAVFPCDKGGKYCITELYLPHDDIRELGLPILDWPNKIDTNDEKLLTRLGFLRHPPLEKIIEIAGSPDLKTRCAAFTYLSKNFDELYDAEYDHLMYEGMPFIPAVKGGVDCVGAHEDVYSDPSWAMMGFGKVHPSVDRRMISRLRMQKAPSSRQVIEVFKERAPKDFDTAAKWFAFLATKQVLSPRDLQQVAEIPIVPIKDLVSHNDSVEDVVRMVPPRECFFVSGHYPDDHLYRHIFTFVDFGEPANEFLKACGVKTKPDYSDIVRILIKDPDDFLRKININAEEGPERYLTELRSVAVGYDWLSEEDKRRMMQAPIFAGYHVSRSPNKDRPATLKDEFQLVRASEILIADDMENRRIFGDFVWLAPQDESLEQFYESMGSGYLSNHIIYNVKPSGESNKNNWPRCEDIRNTILEKLHIFLHDCNKQRLKNPSMHLHWEDETRFLVRGCQDLKVEKRLDSSYFISPERRGDSFECLVSAEITTEANSPVTLWLKDADQVDMYDIAVALCRLLFKTHKKHDVLSLMTILEMDKEVLRRRGYDVDRIDEAHEAAILEDKRNGNERQEETRKRQPGQRSDERYGGGVRLPVKIFDFFRGVSRGSKTAGTVKVAEINKSIDEILEQLSKGEATPKEQEIRNREHRGASKKRKNAEYCAEQKSTDLELVDVGGTAGFIRVWKQKTAQVDIPMNALRDFAIIIHDLCVVFELSNADNSLFNIFWHPDYPDLMGFSRNQLIFLNLAHYTLKHKRRPPGIIYIEWFYIIAHEIAHNKTPFHDEHHELLVSGLSSRFLWSLHDVEAVREYFGCTMACRQ